MGAPPVWALHFVHLEHGILQMTLRYAEMSHYTQKEEHGNTFKKLNYTLYILHLFVPFKSRFDKRI